MAYATAEDLLALCGARELAQVAVPEEMDSVPPELMRKSLLQEETEGFDPAEILAAEAGRLQVVRCLNDAERLIDSHLALRHALPLPEGQVTQSPLSRLCLALARRLLHRHRVPEEVISGYTQAMEWLRELAAGRVALTGDAIRGIGAPACSAPPRTFDDHTLRGFVR